MALTTIAEYKVHAGITGTGEDALLTVLLGVVSAQIRRACGRNLTNGFESTSRTETYDGNDTDRLQLKEWPITSITSVSQIDDAGTSTALAATEYRIDADPGHLFRIGAVSGRFPRDSFGEPVGPEFGTYPCWTAGCQNWSIVYTGGYSTIPDDLKNAVWRLMDIAYAKRRTDPGKQSESLGAYSYTMKTALESDEEVRYLLRDFMTAGGVRAC